MGGRAKQPHMSDDHISATPDTCPNCGKRLQPGETRCEQCGEPIAIGPFGSTNPNTLYWVGLLLAAASFIAPVVALAGVGAALSMWVMHSQREPALQMAVASLFLGFAGYVVNGPLLV